MRNLTLAVLGLSLVACDPRSNATPDSSTAQASTTATPSASTNQPKLVIDKKPKNGPGQGTLVKDIPAPEDVASPPKDAETTPSGLATKVLTKGTGKNHPAKTDRVLVHYTGWTKGGDMFDSSVARGEPISFGVTEVIPGWTEALQLMIEGEKRRLWIPGSLAYGDAPKQPGAPAGQLTFDVELLKILSPPTVPTDVAAPPKDAIKTASGLYYKVQQKGTGTAHPKDTDTVVVNYSGWTKDGKMFDSSVTRGQPAKFPLNHVIKGWTEGVQQMVVGETTRFWIPADLAYGDKPTRGPAGQLTFDIELIEIKQ